MNDRDSTENTLVWVNVMRLKIENRHQLLFAAPPAVFHRLYAIAEGPATTRLSSEDCSFLNTFSRYMRDCLLHQTGITPTCDFCEDAATSENSKQSVLRFAESHLMRSNAGVPQALQHGRPVLTFHDQLWLTCQSEQCRSKAEKALIGEMHGTHSRRIRHKTTLSACLWCARPAMHKCARCQVATYCSKACQRAAWSTHKGACVKLDR